MWVSSAPERLVRAAVDLSSIQGARGGTAGPPVLRTARSWPSTATTSATGQPGCPTRRGSGAGTDPGTSELRDELPTGRGRPGPLTLKVLMPDHAFDLHAGRCRAELPPVTRVIAVSTERDTRLFRQCRHVAAETRCGFCVCSCRSSRPAMTTPGRGRAGDRAFLSPKPLRDRGDLIALEATGASDQVHRLVVPRFRWPACSRSAGQGARRVQPTPSVVPPVWPRARWAAPKR